MKQFSELGIEPTVRNFEGDKISPESVLNRKIKVIGFRIKESKFKEKGNGKCLHMQIELNDEKRVLFTGSGYLMDTIQKISDNDFPFSTTIIKQNKRFEFT
jgi:hypothetical protein